MTPEDMARLHAACFPDAPWDAPAIASLLAQSQVHAITAPGRAGFALVQALPPEAEILTLAVDPAARRQGHGRRLVEAVSADLLRRGCTTLFLEVAADNGAARALYGAAGFTETGRRKDYYKRGAGRFVDAICLQCALT